MKKIKISVLMPVFNGEKYVKEAIKSVLNQSLHPTIMMRTKTVKRIGGYRSWLNGAEDYDLFFRLMKVGKVMNLQQPLIKRRIHSEVVTQRNHLKIELLALACRAMNLKSVLYHS
jgi:hypothetical protein